MRTVAEQGAGRSLAPATRWIFGKGKIRIEKKEI
jgi:hypothetical protein